MRNNMNNNPRPSECPTCNQNLCKCPGGGAAMEQSPADDNSVKGSNQNEVPVTNVSETKYNGGADVTPLNLNNQTTLLGTNDPVPNNSVPSNSALNTIFDNLRHQLNAEAPNGLQATNKPNPEASKDLQVDNSSSTGPTPFSMNMDLSDG